MKESYDFIPMEAKEIGLCFLAASDQVKDRISGKCLQQYLRAGRNRNQCPRADEFHRGFPLPRETGSLLRR